MVFLLLFIIPAAMALVAFTFLRGITWQELVVQLLAQAAVAALSIWVIRWVNVSDSEVLHAVVTGKARETVSCTHDYECNCRKVPNESKEKCERCYRHRFDYAWGVQSALGTTYISTIDEQGEREPPHWTAVRTGEPLARMHAYDNYIKAAPGSLFNRAHLTERYADRLPAYPEVYANYRRDALVLVNGARPAAPHAWNARLAELNSRLGQSKQVDMVVVLVRDLPPDYFYALEQAWLGGKKNSAVLVVGVDSAMRPHWANVMGWTIGQAFQVQLREAVLGLHVIEPKQVLPLLERSVVELYRRRPMADFEYLAAITAPTPMQWLVSMLVGLTVCLGLTLLFHRHEIFGNSGVRSAA